MGKNLKYKNSFPKRELTFTISEELNKLKGKVLAPKKLAEVNELLRNIKSPLPK